MRECIRGFVRPRHGMTSATIIKKFRERCFQNGIVVINVVFCVPVGDGVYSIVANIETEDGK